MTLLSVVIPMYNVEEYIGKCLDSVLSQDFKDFEIIVVDDGSTDNSNSIVREYGKKNGNLKLLEKKNGGQATARNLGLQYSIGKYVYFLDSDDYISENLFSNIINIMEQNDNDLAVFDINVLSQNSSFVWERDTSFELAATMPQNKIFLRSLWDGEKFPEGYWYEDLGIIPVVVAKSKKPIKVSDSWINYVSDREGSQSNDINVDKILDIIPMFDNVSYKFKELNLYEDNYSKLEALCIEHILINTILLKILSVNSKTDKLRLIQSSFNYINENFPDWKDSNYFTGIKMKIKKALLITYRKNTFFGDLLWRNVNLFKNWRDKK